MGGEPTSPFVDGQMDGDMAPLEALVLALSDRC